MKIITDNKKFSLLVAFLVVVVFVVSFSNSPGVAQAPDSNLATVDAVNGQVVSEGAIFAPLVVNFRPSFKEGTKKVYPSYNIAVKDIENRNNIVEFRVNIETKVSIPPDYAVVDFDWSNRNSAVATVTIKDPQIVAGLRYPTYISAINDVSNVLSEPLIKIINVVEIAPVVPTVEPIATNVAGEQDTQNFWNRLTNSARLRWQLALRTISSLFDNVANWFRGFTSR